MKQVNDYYICYVSGQRVPSSSVFWATADVSQYTCQNNKAAALQDFTVIHEEKETLQRTANQENCCRKKITSRFLLQFTLQLYENFD